LIVNGKVNNSEKPQIKMGPDSCQPLSGIKPNLWYHEESAIQRISQIQRRCTMKVSQAVDFHLQYHQANSKKKYGQNL